MAEPDHVTHVPPDARTPGESTAGMTREQAIAVDGLWAGLVRTAPGAVSDWHHHGEYETSIYVVTGRLRMESGPDGADVIDAEPGDFLHVPPRLVHREANPDDIESQIVVVRA